MKSLLKKLHAIQDAVQPITKDAANPFYKSKYATLDAIQHHIQPHLTKMGLVLSQPTIVLDGVPYVKSILFDVETAESIESMFPIIVSKPSAQEYGSAVSYAKRYSISGLLNLIIQDEDDDGEAAEGRKEAKQDDRPWLNENTDQFKKAKDYVNSGGSVSDIEKKYKISKKVKDLLTNKN